MPLPIRRRSVLSKRPPFLALVCLLGSALGPAAFAGPAEKGETPCFWQADPDAGFANAGADYCAPVSVSDGLIYLKKARGFDELVDRTDHDGQIELVKDLATEMNTDPKSGTGPGQIMIGLVKYIKKRGDSIKRLEVMTWRDVGGVNKPYVVGTQPDADWFTAAVKDPNFVVIFNFGWYKQKANGTYQRNGGHWVNVVGTGAEKLQFKLHNPLLKPEKQATNNTIDLELVDDSFTYTDDDGTAHSLAGYYEAHGPGLPFGVSAAVLDGVIVFQLGGD